VFATRRRRASPCSIRSITVGCASRNGSTSGPDSVKQRRRLVATTSAAGGWPVSTEISPKKSPLPSFASSRPSIDTLASPSRMT
jgi:hypothetical protein